MKTRWVLGLLLAVVAQSQLTELNKVIEDATFNLDVSGIQPFVGGKVQATVTFDNQVTCKKLSLGNIGSTGVAQSPQTFPGVDGVQERFDLRLRLSGIDFECIATVCVELGAEKSCGNEVKIEPGNKDGSTITTQVSLRSEDFDTKPPVAMPQDLTQCGTGTVLRLVDSLKMSVDKDFQGVTGLDEKEMNKLLDEKGGGAQGYTILTQALEGAACRGLFTFLNVFIEDVNRVLFTQEVTYNLPSIGGAEELAEIQAKALEEEAKIVSSLPANTQLVDLEKDFVTSSLMFPQHPLPRGTLQTPETVADQKALAKDGRSILVDVLESFATDQAPGLVQVPSLLFGLQTHGADPIPSFSVLELLPEASRTVTLKFGFLGTITLSIDGLSLFTGKAEVIPDVTQQFISKYSLFNPPFIFDSGSFEASLRLSMALSFQDSTGKTIRDTVEGPFSAKLDLSRLGVLTTSFFGLHAPSVAKLRLGDVISSTANCVFSAFQSSPTLTTLMVGSAGASVEASATTRNIGLVVGEAAASLAPVLKSVFNNFAGTFLSQAGKQYETADCPNLIDTQNTDELFDFSSGPLATFLSKMDADAFSYIFFMVSGYLERFGKESMSLPSLYEVRISQDDGTQKSLELLPELFNSKDLAFSEVSLFRASPTDPYNLKTIIKIPEQASFYTRLSFRETILAAGEPIQPPRILSTFDVNVYIDNLDMVLDSVVRIPKDRTNMLSIHEFIYTSCWLAETNQGSGISNLRLTMNDLRIDISCVECDSFGLELEEKLNAGDGSSKASERILEIIQSFLEYTSETYSVENWETGVVIAKDTCEATVSSDAPSTVTVNVEPRAASVLLLSIGASLSAVIGLCTCKSISRSLRIKKDDENAPPRRYITESLQIMTTSRTDPKDLIHRKPSMEPESAASQGRPSHILEEKFQEHGLLFSKETPVLLRMAISVVIAFGLLFLVVGFALAFASVDFRGDLFDEEVQVEFVSRFTLFEIMSGFFSNRAYSSGLLVLSSGIMWPMTMGLTKLACWILPGRLMTSKRRMQLLGFINSFGKVAFAPLLLGSLLSASLTLEAQNNPNDSLLPPSFWAVSIEVDGDYGALAYFLGVCSIMFAINVIVLHLRKRKHRRKIKEFDRKSRADMMDAIPMHLRDIIFQSKGEAGEDIFVKLTPAGFRALQAGLFLVLPVLFISASLPLAQITWGGALGQLLESQGQDVQVNISLFSLTGALIGSSVSAGQAFLGLVLFVTVIMAPLMHTWLIIYTISSKLTLRQAYMFKEYSKLLRSWCCMELFLSAVCLIVVELPGMAKTLSSKDCDRIYPIIRSALIGLDSTSAADLSPSSRECLRLGADVKSGSSLFLLTLVLYNVSFMASFRLIYAYAAQRESFTLRKRRLDSNPFARRAPKFFKRQLIKIGFLKMVAAPPGPGIVYANNALAAGFSSHEASSKRGSARSSASSATSGVVRNPRHASFETSETFSIRKSTPSNNNKVSPARQAALKAKAAQQGSMSSTGSSDSSVKSAKSGKSRRPKGSSLAKSTASSKGSSRKPMKHDYFSIRTMDV